MKKPNILFLIPARSGSKGIPDKNIKILGDFPLFVHRYNSVTSISLPNEIWLSTDSPKYAKIADSFNIKVPFLRPKDLSLDSSSSNSVVLHAMTKAVELNLNFDVVALLEPTSPFVSQKSIYQAILKLWNNPEADAIVAVKESRPNSIFIQAEDEYLNEFYHNIKNLEDLGRQSLKKEITPSGGFYISKWSSFLEKKSFYTTKTLSFLLEDEETLEIDEPIDFTYAQFLIHKK